METLLRIGLSNAVVALLMALVVVTVACVWRRPAVLHALWLLVLVKLVTPPLVWVRIPWPIIPDSPPVVASTAEPAAVEPLPEGDTVFVPDSETMRETPSVELSTSPLVSESATFPDALTPSEPLAILKLQNIAHSPIPGWMAATCGVWLAGALGWYALALVRLRRFRQMLRHAIPAPESLRQRTQRLAEKLRLRRCPGVWLVPGRVAPMLWAAGGRPRILFPADLLKQVGVEQQNALLVHELAHLRRRDHWVRWLEFAAAGLYWWNPVLWFARRELREAEEQCCDAWVTSTLPGAGKTYATALLETLDFLSDAPPATPLLASGVGRVVDLKRRLTMIMRGTTPRTLGWRGGAMVVGLGALLLPMLPAWVQAQPTPKTEEAKAVDYEPSGNLDALVEEAKKDGAELQALQAELAKTQAVAAQLTARIEAVTARAKKRQADAAAKAYQEAIRAVVKTPDGDAPKGRIIAEINGAADPAKIQELIKQIQGLQVIRPGPAPEVVVIDQGSGRIIMKAVGGNLTYGPDGVHVSGSGRIIMNAGGGKAEGVDLPPPAGMRWIVLGNDKGLRPGQERLAVAATDTDKRIIELEMKLKLIMDEVEKLRQERKPTAPQGDKESKPHTYGPAPMDKIPYLDLLFKQVGPGQQEQAVMQERLRAEMEREKAQAVERDASQAKLKMLEEEIARLKNAQGSKGPAKP
jgi:beta-lactamase regulating signal transducer with metallopeptidase domain/molecular chaperone GrpE (heat shock protein)